MSMRRRFPSSNFMYTYNAFMKFYVLLNLKGGGWGREAEESFLKTPLNLPIFGSILCDICNLELEKLQYTSLSRQKTQPRMVLTTIASNYFSLTTKLETILQYWQK